MISEKIPVNVWLEVKIPTGRLSMSQGLFREAVKSVGCHYYVVRSIEDVEKALKEVEIFTWENINRANGCQLIHYNFNKK